MKNIGLYYHNPRCSKSREGLALLQDQGVSLHIKEYLNECVSKTETLGLFIKLGLEPCDCIRQKEPAYLGLDPKDFSKEEWAVVIHENPILLERPILVIGDHAVIGRPPEKLLELVRVS